MIVMKFGGSSVADAEHIRHVAEIVRERLDRKPVVTLSAMGDTTDILIEAAEKALILGPLSVEPSLEKITAPHLAAVQELGLSKTLLPELRELLGELGSLLSGISLIKELTAKTRDYLVSFGERLSTRIVARHFQAVGINARALDAWDAGFISDSAFTFAELLPESWLSIPNALTPLVEEGVIPIVTGYIAKDASGAITTLGRGGSDLSATMIAAACRAEEAQVWKDVDGILTADPRIVENARPVSAVTYDEAAELAFFGAQVLHPRAMQPCIKTGVPVLVKNSYNPEAPGSVISASLPDGARPVRAITTRGNVTLVDIVSSRMVGQYGFLEKVFSCFARHRISIDMVATSEVSVSLTLDEAHDLSAVTEELALIAGIEVKTKKAIVTIIGLVGRSSEILENAFAVCSELGVQVQMLSQGASKVNISFVVDGAEAATAVRGLHKKFFENES
ncbi:MAG: aspartate kinase [Spirochaetaceae bacterium]|jgi:aspartate kinase|nr:aspartate kinase [Spirochaetaceae bacterium]